jgi:hypothetical protein
MDLNANLINSNGESSFNIMGDHILRMVLQDFGLILISNDGSFGMIKMPQNHLEIVKEQITKDKNQHDDEEYNKAMMNLETISKNFEETGRDELVYYLQ